MKIGYISHNNLEDKHAWSGTIHNLAKIISKRHEIVPIVVNPNKWEKIMKGFDFLFSLGKRKEGYFYHWFNSYRLHKKLKEISCDVYFAPAISDLISYGIPRDKKLIYLSDAVFRLMAGYYWSDLDERTEAYLNHCEAASLERADAVIFASDWAKDGAIRYYHTDPQKIHVLPFGANLTDAYQRNLSYAEKSEIKLLLVGVEWERKGVDLAIDCVRALNEMQNQRKFSLTIIGVDKPVGKEYEPYIHIIGRLNKDIPDEYQRMIDYYQNSDIFLLPTKAECAGIVFSEAAAYGMPSITHKTGGVESYVEDGVTGRCLPLGSTGQDFANAIMEIVENGRLEELSKAARKKYEKELNWNSWLVSFDCILEELKEK